MSEEMARRRVLYSIAAVLAVTPIVVWIYWPADQGPDATGYQIGRDFMNAWAGPQLAFGGRFTTLSAFAIRGPSAPHCRYA
jgi:hypothetical protein